MSNQPRREWLARLKDNDPVAIIKNGERLPAFIFCVRPDNLLGIFTISADGTWKDYALFRARDGYLKGRCLCSPRPRIEPVEGASK